MSSIYILLVQEKEAEIMFTPEAFKEIAAANNNCIIRNEQAIAFQAKDAAINSACVPDPILPGIFLSRVVEQDIPQYMQSYFGLTTIPKAMLTKAGSKRVIPASYKYNLHCYISEKVDLNKFFPTEKKMENFPLSIVDLSKTNHHGA